MELVPTDTGTDTDINSEPIPNIDRGPGRQVFKVGHQALRVPLTDEEREAKAQQLARLLQEQVELKAEHKEKVAELKEEATKLQLKVDEVRDDVLLKSERRSVEVEYVGDFHRGVVETIRQDTGAVVSSRPMSDNERQLELQG